MKGKRLQSFADKGSEVLLVGFMGDYWMYSPVQLIVRCDLLVEEEDRRVLRPPFEDGDASIIAGGFDCNGKQVSTLRAAFNRDMEAPDEKT
jgi:hypothetical protein